MVSAVSSGGFDVASYLNNIKGTNTPGQKPPANNGAQPASGDASSSSATPGVNDVLSLLQQTSPSSQQGAQLSSLIGGDSSSDPLSGLYSTLLYNDTTAQAVQGALTAQTQQQTQATTQTNPVQNLIANLNTASNAYNQTLLTNAQSVLKANNGTLA